MGKISKMQKLLFIMLLLAIPALPAFSQENDVITSIEIIGLKRTKPHIARYHLEKFIGLERSAFDENEIFAAVKSTGVLEPVSAEFVDTSDGLLMRVTVLEKWSIFPFPLFFAGSGEYTFGLFLFDANAFGLCDSMAVGGMYGSGGWSVIAMYNHTPNRKGVPGWNGFFMYSRQDEEDVDRDEKILREYSADQLRFSFGLSYNFLDHLTGSAGLSFENILLNDKNIFFNSPQDDFMLIGFSSRISLHDSSWDGYFLSGRSASLEYSYHLAIYGSSFHQIEFRGSYDQMLIPGFRMIIKSGGVWKSAADELFEDGPQSASVSILPRNYSAMHYAGLSIGLEKYLYRFKWGTLSVHGSWQGVYSYSETLGSQFDHGPAAGILLYLSRLALPAIGAGAAYNIVSGLFQFTFSVGMSF